MCVRHASRTARRRLDLVPVKRPASASSTKIVVCLAFLGNLSSHSLGGLWLVSNHENRDEEICVDEFSNHEYREGYKMQVSLGPFLVKSV